MLSKYKNPKEKKRSHYSQKLTYKERAKKKETKEKILAKSKSEDRELSDFEKLPKNILFILIFKELTLEELRNFARTNSGHWHLVKKFHPKQFHSYFLHAVKKDCWPCIRQHKELGHLEILYTNKKNHSLPTTFLSAACMHGNDKLLLFMLASGVKIPQDKIELEKILNKSLAYPVIIEILYNHGIRDKKLVKKALEAQYLNVAKYLIQQKDFYDLHRNEPLLLDAVTYGDEEIIRLLLNQGFDVNMINKKNDTPLLIAFEEQKEEIALLLLKHGANLFTKNKYGVAPSDYVSNSPRIVEFIQKALSEHLKRITQAKVF